jgi:hypothetical protein
VIDSTTTLATAPSAENRAQHHAGEHRGQCHHRQAEIADLQQRADEQAAVERRTEQMRQAGCREQRQRAGDAAGADDTAANGGEAVQDRVHADL